MYLIGQINFEYSQFELADHPVVKFGLLCLLPDIKDLIESLLEVISLSTGTKLPIKLSMITQ